MSQSHWFSPQFGNRPRKLDIADQTVSHHEAGAGWTRDSLIIVSPLAYTIYTSSITVSHMHHYVHNWTSSHTGALCRNVLGPKVQQYKLI